MSTFIRRLKNNLRVLGIGNLALVVLAEITRELCPLLSSYIQKYLTNALLSNVWSSVMTWITLQVFLWFFSTLINGYEQNIRQMSRAKIDDYNALEIRKKLMKLNVKFWEREENIDVFNKAEESSRAYYNVFLNMTTFLIFIVTIVTAAISLFSIMPFSLVVLAVLIVANGVFAVKWSDLEYMQSLRALEPERRRGYYRSLFYNPQTEKEIKAYHIGDWLLQKYENVSESIFRQMHRLTVRKGGFVVLFDMASMLIKISLWIYAAFQTLNGHIQVGDCVLFIGLWNTLFSLTENARFYATEWFASKRGVEDLNRFLDFPEDEKNAACETPHTIALEQVSFRYPSKERYALQNVNLTFCKGQCSLILGANGAGKSTLIKLLLKHYQPSSGRITINGRQDLCDIRGLNAGYIAQADVHFSLSIRDNITFGQEYDPVLFQEVLQKAKIADLVDSMEDKENTLLGKAYAEGRELSGGQWQRISFARLLYRQSDIIILDEPTSNLDPIAEKNLYSEIKTIFYDKIVILISHRLNSIQIADQIVFLSDGTIQGVGTHEALLKQCPSYSEMYHLQQEFVSMGG